MACAAAFAAHAPRADAVDPHIPADFVSKAIVGIRDLYHSSFIAATWLPMLATMLTKPRSVCPPVPIATFYALETLSKRGPNIDPFRHLHEPLQIVNVLPITTVEDLNRLLNELAEAVWAFQNGCC